MPYQFLWPINKYHLNIFFFIVTLEYFQTYLIWAQLKKVEDEKSKVAKLLSQSSKIKNSFF